MVHEVTGLFSHIYEKSPFVAAVFAAIGAIRDIMPGHKEKKYRKAKLIDHDGDLSKRWYILFYVFSPEKNRLIRKRYYENLNKINTKSGRYQYAARAIVQINKILEDGYQAIDSRPQEKKWSECKLSEFITFYLNAKKTDYSASYYQIQILVSQKWADFEKKNKIERAASVKGQEIQRFLDGWQKESGFAEKTYNEYRAFLSKIFKELVKMDQLKANPVDKVDKKRVTKKLIHLPYSEYQLKEIRKEAEKQGKKQLVLFIDFCFYTLARPRKELHLLKVKEIGPKMISIPKERGKTGARNIPIVGPLEKIIQKEGLRSYPANHFVFAHGEKPGERPYTSTHFYDQLAKILIALKLNGLGYNLYSFKHTGAIMAYQAGIPIHIIQIMCGHSSPSQTEEYLANLGLISPADPYLDIWPEIK